jgi:type IV pilus assembly protein PilB
MRKERNTLLLLVHDPSDVDALDTIGITAGKTDIGGIASRTQLAEYISGGSTGVDLKSQLVTSSLDKSKDSSRDSSKDASRDSSLDSDGGANESGIVRLVDRFIVNAVQGRASDIHLEPRKDVVILRYRVDGVCVIRDEIPKKMQNPLLARLKLMAGVNISERRIPQDGRIKMTIDGTVVDFRVSACPAVHGESIVLRPVRVRRPRSIPRSTISTRPTARSSPRKTLLNTRSRASTKFKFVSRSA